MIILVVAYTWFFVYHVPDRTWIERLVWEGMMEERRKLDYQLQDKNLLEWQSPHLKWHLTAHQWSSMMILSAIIHQKQNVSFRLILLPDISFVTYTVAFWLFSFRSFPVLGANPPLPLFVPVPLPTFPSFGKKENKTLRIQRVPKQ